MFQVQSMVHSMSNIRTDSTRKSARSLMFKVHSTRSTSVPYFSTIRYIFWVALVILQREVVLISLPEEQGVRCSKVLGPRYHVSVAVITLLVELAQHTPHTHVLTHTHAHTHTQTHTRTHTHIHTHIHTYHPLPHTHPHRRALRGAQGHGQSFLN